MLTGGRSQQSNNYAIKEFRVLQIKHEIWQVPIAYLWYFWAKIKNVAKYLIKYKINGFH